MRHVFARALPATILSALMLAACSGSGDGGNNGSAGGGAGAGGGESQLGQPDNLSTDQNNMAVPVQLPSPAAVTSIPSAFRGRWAAVASDCTAVAPGLLVVEAAGLSIGGARLATRSLATQGTDTLMVQATRSGGDRQVAERLTLIDNGRTLIRQQQAPGAAINYLRCPA